ncbi:MAG: efflux RND transporter periplasmic adaptor subunit [Porticoccaceae bacterium]
MPGETSPFHCKLLGGVPAVAILLALVLSGCGEKAAPPPPPGPVEVGVVTLAASDVVLAAEFSGRTVAYRVAEVRPQAAGIVQRRLFTEGANVVAGETLYQIDPQSYRAELQRTEAALQRVLASEKVARLKADRYQGLIAKKLISQQDYDDADAALKEASAAVAVARAERDIARINLEYTSIRAPISGRIGRSLVTEGALVEAEQEAPLAVIQQIDPLFVDITQSSVDLIRLKSDLAAGRLAPAGEGAAMRLVLEDGTPYAHPGALAFSEVRVDESTGNVTLRGTVPNPDHLLLPGMFVRAGLDQAVRRDAILAPQKGVSFDYTGKAFAMVVDGDNKIQRRFLNVGRAMGDQWLVLEGLAAGERIVIDGLQKIREGVEVTTVPAAGGTAEAH